MAAFILQEADSMWRGRDVLWVPYEVEGHLSPRCGTGKVLVFPRAEQFLARRTWRLRRPAGPGKLRGVAIAT